MAEKANEKEYLKLVSKRIKEIRLDLKMNFNEISDELGVPYQKYTRLERGGGCSVNFLIHFANFASKHNYNLNWLLKEDNSNESKLGEEMFFLSFDRKNVDNKLDKAIKVLGEVKDIMNDI